MGQPNLSELYNWSDGHDPSQPRNRLPEWRGTEFRQLGKPNLSVHERRDHLL